jgi:DNA-binding transcriptional LysR family regulator
VLVSHRGPARGHVDRYLNGLGRTRNVVATVPHYMAAATIALARGAIATVPGRVATRMIEIHGDSLCIADAPLELPGWPVSMAWDRARSSDVAHAWLRGHVRAACAELRADDPAGTS